MRVGYQLTRFHQSTQGGPAMGDQEECHRNSKSRRPLLTLAGERCEWTGQPIANYRVQERLATEELARKEASEQARKRAEEREQERLARREARERKVAQQADNERRSAELRRERWIALAREAAAIGLVPDPTWSEQEFRSWIWDRKQEIRYEEEELAREEYWAEDLRRAAEKLQRRQKEEAARFLAKAWEQSVARNRSLNTPLDPDDVGEQWEYIPHIVKFGTYDRYPDAWGFGQEYRSISRINFPARNPQKQRRTWEAKAPRQWRRKDQCAERWNQLFIYDPAAE
jgi:hypothetical protein